MATPAARSCTPATSAAVANMPTPIAANAVTKHVARPRCQRDDIRPSVARQASPGSSVARGTLPIIDTFAVEPETYAGASRISGACGRLYRRSEKLAVKVGVSRFDHAATNRDCGRAWWARASSTARATVSQSCAPPWGNGAGGRAWKRGNQ